MIKPRKMETPKDKPETQKDSVGDTNWERFYREFRKPGYISGYEILQRLGGGVFGIVFKAKKESIGKAYAIKFLRIEDPSVRTQVLNELETVSLFAQVDHPNLVTIEDKGLVDGIPYIIMGYAGDETLKSRLQEGPMSQAQALSVMRQVLQGVKALHDHGLAHFDLKPANLFIHGDIVRVGDYGLSKLIRESCSSLSFGRGTPYYMAPEMLRRKGDQRSDIYSLGVIFFECLTGKVPFEGENEWEVLKAHEERAVVFPPEVPQRLQSMLRRMLVKDPELRVQDLGEILASMDESPSTLPIVSLPPKLPLVSKVLPPPIPPLSSVPRFQISQRLKRRPRKCSTKAPKAALAISLVVGGLIILTQEPIFRKRIGLGLLMAFGLSVFFLIQRREKRSHPSARSARGGSSLPSGGQRLNLLLGVLFGFFLLLALSGFLFLGVSGSSSTTIKAARAQADWMRANEEPQHRLAPILPSIDLPESKVEPEVEVPIKIHVDRKTTRSK